MKSLIVAKYSFLEAFKSKLLTTAVFIAISILLITYVASELSYGQPDKIAIDIGLGLTSIALKIMAIFYGVGIIQSEVESRSIYLILSRPISRSQFFIGRFLGMTGMLSLNAILLGPFSFLLFMWLGGSLSPVLIWALLFLLIESVLLLLIVVVASLISSKVIAILLAITAYVGRYATENLLQSNQFAQSEIIQFILKSIQYLIPNFTKLNLKDIVLYQDKLDMSFVLLTLAQSSIYIVVFLLIGVWLIREKNFD